MPRLPKQSIILLILFLILPFVPATADQPGITTVNQTGYFTDSRKIGFFYSSEETTPPSWQVRSESTDSIVLTGITEAGFYDSTSGNVVYRADFSEIIAPGRFMLSINGVDSYPFDITDHLYTDLKRDALHYFYLNRSGIQLLPEYAGEQWARPAGHITDSAVTCFQGDADGQHFDGCDYSLDVSGGWYDAGDYGKYVVNAGITVWTLLNLYERDPQAFPDGSMRIPENTNGVPDILDEARWEIEFMLRMQVPDGEPLAGMVHHKIHDLHWTAFPAKPPIAFANNDPQNGRYLMPPGTAATLNLAAAGAQCARVWREIDPTFADRCLATAEKAWTAADTHPDILYGSIPGDGGGDYSDDDLFDEFYWAAAELYITTGRDIYYNHLIKSPYLRDFSSTMPVSWRNTAALGSMSLALLPNNLSRTDNTLLRQQIVDTADIYLMQGSDYYVPFATDYRVTGSNSGVLNIAIIMALAYDFSGNERYLNGVIASMDYLLGANALNLSFVSGYGTVAMLHPHHRFWANEPGYPSPPPGAIAGGAHADPVDETASSLPDDTPPARRYVDSAASYSTNEVAINWNAPLVWVAAWLDQTQ